jgi:hypothetical protein
MINHMKQILVQLDDRTARLLEDVAPGRSRKRSEFVRFAIARALQEVLEERTREAYRRWPDDTPAFDPDEWAPEADAVHPSTKRAPRRRARREATRTRR